VVKLSQAFTRTASSCEVFEAGRLKLHASRVRYPEFAATFL
jgi:hypothetical protein